MLWRRAWDETKWRYLIPQLLMIGWASYMASAFHGAMAHGWEMAHQLAASPIAENHRWAAIDAAGLNLHSWLLGCWNLLFMPLALFAALIGTGGVVAQSGGGGALFTLSLPVTRDRLLLTRVAVGLAELAALAFTVVAGLWIFADDRSLPEFMSAGLATVGLGIFAQLTVFGLAIWLSTLFTDVWRPALLALASAWLTGRVIRWTYLALAHPLTVYRGRHGPDLPELASLAPPTWMELAASVGVAVLALLAARWTLARRDF